MATRYIQGGEKLQARLAEIGRNANKAATVKVGFLENAKYSDGTPVAMVAMIQDFGAPAAGVPPTGFFRNMVAAKSNEWPDGVAQALVADNYDAEKALGAVGAAIAGQLRQAIIDTTEPPLSPITLMLRKMFGNHPEEITGKAVGEAAARVKAGEDPGGVSTKRLIWTGHMLNSVASEVE
jgi:hypothetical protein